MSNFVYDKAHEGFANAQFALLTDTIVAQLIDTSLYTPNSATDEFLSSVPSGARIGSPVALSGKVNALGVFDAADLSVTGLVAAPSIEAVLIYKATGSDATSRLLTWVDNATGLPVTAGATQVDIQWNNGANKIFRI